MPIKLPVPDASWSQTSISLGGESYDITYRYNERDHRWRMDIYQEDTPVKLGLKIVEWTPVLSYLHLDAFNHGEIICVRNKADPNPVGRDNLGIGKSYELMYISNNEILNAVG